MKKAYIQFTCRCFSTMAVKVLCCLSLVLFSATSVAQVTIGTNKEPARGALLEIKEQEQDQNNATATKGMLFPRVQLTDNTELYPMYSSSDNTYISNKAALKKQHVGLTVFNVTDTHDFFTGLYMWNGTEWRRVTDVSSISPDISMLVGSTSTLYPDTYTAGNAYEGLMKVTYVGGNGGSYGGSTQVITADNDLQLERYSGKLNIGSGEILYRVYGVPINSSTTPTPVLIDFLSHSTTVKLGTNDNAAFNSSSLSGDVIIGNDQVNTSPTGDLLTGGYILTLANPITITESGSYSVSVRLYGSTSNTSAGNGEYAVYLVSPKPGSSSDNNIIDSQKIVVSQSTVPSTSTTTGYLSNTVVLCGYVEAGRTLEVRMCKLTTATSSDWTLFMGTPETARTSLVWWKL